MVLKALPCHRRPCSEAIREGAEMVVLGRCYHLQRSHHNRLREGRKEGKREGRKEGERSEEGKEEYLPEWKPQF